MNEDTVSLLSACEAGAQMAIGAMDGVLKDVRNTGLRQTLQMSLRQHSELGVQARQLLAQSGAQPAEPGVMAKGMSWLKTNWTLMLHPGDAGAAELVTDGCDMGVKTLARTRNRCPGASGEARAVAGRLMELERQLSSELLQYL